MVGADKLLRETTENWVHECLKNVYAEKKPLPFHWIFRDKISGRRLGLYDIMKMGIER